MTTAGELAAGDEAMTGCGVVRAADAHCLAAWGGQHSSTARRGSLDRVGRAPGLLRPRAKPYVGRPVRRALTVPLGLTARLMACQTFLATVGRSGAVVGALLDGVVQR